MTPVLTFRGKPETIWFGDVPRKRVKVPAFTRSHCNMEAFRSSRKFGPYANSDLFPALLAREVKLAKVPPYIYADESLPSGVTLDTSGFLWKVTISFEERAA